MPQCPKCKTPTLEAISLKRPVPETPHLVGPSRCTTCNGVWMPHEAITLEIQPTDVAGAPLSAGSSGSDAQAGFCPCGHGLLMRAMAEAPLTFHLDRCETCRGVWFDAGEWAAVAATEWLRHLDELWDPVHRRKMRELAEHEHRLAALETALGEATFQKVVDAAAALRDHPARSVALAFLLDETRRPAAVRPAGPEPLAVRKSA